MKRWIGFLLPLCLLLGGCAAPETPPGPPPASVWEPTPSGEARFVYAAEPDTPEVLFTRDETARILAANTLDTLLCRDAAGRLCPALAERWEYDGPTRTWTLTLREDALWVDADGEPMAPVTAGDFAFAAARILDPANESPGAEALFGVVENAEEYYQALDRGESADFSSVGVRAPDDRTLCYTLAAATPDFLWRLADWPYLPARPENALWSCGAYRIESREPQVATVLRKNERFRAADQVFIETVRLIFDPDAASDGPRLAAEGAVSAAPVSESTARAWLLNADLAPLLSRERCDPTRAWFLSFNFNVRPLSADYVRSGEPGWTLDEGYEPENWQRAVNNESFRQAIRHALDRRALWPDGYRENTITPAGFAADWPAREEPWDPALAADFRDAARAELAAEGAHFPVLVRFPFPEGDAAAQTLGEEIERMLEDVLGADFIDVLVESVSAPDFRTRVRRSGEYMLMACDWDADSPDADTWTRPFYQPREPDGGYGRGYRYGYLAAAALDETASAEAVETYFTLVEAARAETQPEARQAAFAAAENWLLDRALAIPLGVEVPGWTISHLDESARPTLGLGRDSLQGVRLLPRARTLDESLPPKPTPDAPAPEEEAGEETGEETGQIVITTEKVKK